MRKNNRRYDELREVKIIRNYISNSEGSCFISLGNTMVICCATIEKKVPHFLKNKEMGWLHAEYGMLPRSTDERISRERTSSRIYEIQRIIGRSLRGVLDLHALKGYTITIDCDVIQADGGTRSACITGGFIALYDAVKYMIKNKMIHYSPIIEFVAGVSVGKVNSKYLLDLDYEEDVNAEIDMNVAMTENLGIVDIQVTGEKRPFTKKEFDELLSLATIGIKEIIKKQKEVIGGNI